MATHTHTEASYNWKPKGECYYDYNYKDIFAV